MGRIRTHNLLLTSGDVFLTDSTTVATLANMQHSQRITAYYTAGNSVLIVSVFYMGAILFQLVRVHVRTFYSVILYIQVQGQIYEQVL